MKNLITAAVAALGIATSAVSATAADWTPPGPIKLMIAFAAGGGADTQARLDRRRNGSAHRLAVHSGAGDRQGRCEPSG